MREEIVKTIIPVIGRYYLFLGGGNPGKIPYLFFPTIPVNKYNVEAWTWYESHSEASLEFYRECKVMPKGETEKVLKQYLNLYPTNKNEVYEIKMRMCHAWNLKAWKEGEK
jgi:hypothetical protein